MCKFYLYIYVIIEREASIILRLSILTTTPLLYSILYKKKFGNISLTLYFYLFYYWTTSFKLSYLCFLGLYMYDNDL